MTLFEFIKYLHILSAIMMLGATLCNGVLHGLSIQEGFTSHRASILKGVMQINRILMAPSFLGLLIAGPTMVYMMGMPFSTTWVWISLTLTLMIFAGFIFGYQVEKRLERLVEQNLNTQSQPILDEHKRLLSLGFPIGSLATLFSFAVLYLMIVQPS